MCSSDEKNMFVGSSTRSQAAIRAARGPASSYTAAIPSSSPQTAMVTCTKRIPSCDASRKRISAENAHVCRLLVKALIASPEKKPSPARR